MKILRNNNTIRLIIFILALQILNMSIDAPYVQMQSKKANTDNFNYIDTYVEYIAEVILKCNNAIPESGNRERKELLQHNQFEIIFQALEVQELVTLYIISSATNKSSHTDNYVYRFIKEIVPPPPKFS